MANTVALPNNAVAGTLLDHSIFFAKIVNRRDYSIDTLVLDTGATNHTFCSLNFLTSITVISYTMVELPDGETAIVTHIGTVKLSSHITLTNFLFIGDCL